MQDFVKLQRADKKWVRTGEAIDAGAKVYSCRVDHIHSETYRMLNEVCINALDNKDEENADGPKDQEADKRKKSCERLYHFDRWRIDSGKIIAKTKSDF